MHSAHHTIRRMNTTTVFAVVSLIKRNFFSSILITLMESDNFLLKWIQNIIHRH